MINDQRSTIQIADVVSKLVIVSSDISVTVSSMIINVETIGDRITKRQCSCVFASFRLDPLNGVVGVGGSSVCDADGDGG